MNPDTDLHLIGPNPQELLAKARQAVMDQCVALAERDGVPATQRAMYVLKLAQARSLLKDATPSRLITEEARLRGVNPIQLAQSIVAMAEASENLELRRTEINLELDAASDDAEEIVAILTKWSVPLNIF